MSIDQEFRNINKGISCLKKHRVIIYLVLLFVTIGYIYRLLETSLVLGGISVVLGFLAFFGILRAENKISKKVFETIVLILWVTMLIVAFAFEIRLQAI